MQRIFLVGFMGVGKSTLGRIVADKLDLPFFDFDQYLEERQQMAIPEIFEKFGESYFRKLEHDLLLEFIQNHDRFLLGTGGGLPCFGENMDLMNDAGVTIYLRSSSKALVQRLLKSSGNRPLIKDKSPQELLEYVEDTLTRREEFYLRSKYQIELNLERGKDWNAALILECLGLPDF